LPETVQAAIAQTAPAPPAPAAPAPTAPRRSYAPTIHSRPLSRQDVAERNRAVVAAILQAVDYRDGSHTIDGREASRRGFKQRPWIQGMKEVEYPPEVEALGNTIYSRFYKAQDGDETSGLPTITDKVRREMFYAELRANHASRHSWSAGWKAAGEPKDGRLLVESAVMGQRTVPVADFRPDGDGSGSVKWERHSTTMQPSYYHFFGEAGVPWNRGRISRFYFNLSYLGAIPFVRLLSRELNAAGVIFQAKTLTDPNIYAVPDSGVLYMPASAIERALPALQRVYAQLAPYMNRTVPAFARPVGLGIAFADDPMTGESFGQKRAALIALALWEHRQAGGARGEGELDAVVQALAAKGYPLDRFHLEPGSDWEPDVWFEHPLANPYEEA